MNLLEITKQFQAQKDNLKGLRSKQMTFVPLKYFPIANNVDDDDYDDVIGKFQINLDVDDIHETL